MIRTPQGGRRNEMSEQSDRVEITPTDMLDYIRVSFEIAVSALVQAGVSLGILGLEPTKREVQDVVEDLRKAIAAIDDHKSNRRITKPAGREEG
jgi:hypothetical protein